MTHPELDKVIWNGRRPSPEEYLDRYDVDVVRYRQNVQCDIEAWITKSKSPVYVLHSEQAPPIRDDYKSYLDDTRLQKAMDHSRMRKTPHEIRLIREANDITADAH